MDRIYRTRIERCYSWRTILLVLAGIAVNASLPQLMRVGNVPLYLDNIGSVLVAALAGPIPGMIAAFVSNYLGYLGEPSSIMFGFLTVAMAWIAGDCSRRGLLRTMKGYLWLLAAFTGVGGAVGSVLGMVWTHGWCYDRSTICVLAQRTRIVRICSAVCWRCYTGCDG